MKDKFILLLLIITVNSFNFKDITNKAKDYGKDFANKANNEANKVVVKASDLVNKFDIEVLTKKSRNFRDNQVSEIIDYFLYSDDPEIRALWAGYTVTEELCKLVKDKCSDQEWIASLVTGDVKKEVAICVFTVGKQYAQDNNLIKKIDPVMFYAHPAILERDFKEAREKCAVLAYKNASKDIEHDFFVICVSSFLRKHFDVYGYLTSQCIIKCVDEIKWESCLNNCFE